MTRPVSLDEAKAFLRVTDAAEDAVIDLLLDAAQGWVEAQVGQSLDDASPAPLRLAVLRLVAHSFEHRELADPPVGLMEPWIAAWRPVRL